MDPLVERDIRMAIQGRGYFLLRKMGSGAFGTVYEAISTDEAITEKYAIKIINKLGSENLSNNSSVYQRELIMSRALSNSNCVNYGAKLYDHFELKLSNGDQWYVLVQQYIQGMTLYRFINQSFKTLDDNVKYNICLEITKAVNCIHNIQISGTVNDYIGPIAHRDLKSVNIMISTDRIPKLIDLGISCFPSSKPLDKNAACSNVSGSPRSLPIELLWYFIYNQEERIKPQTKTVLPKGVPLPRTSKLTIIDSNGQQYQRLVDPDNRHIYDYRKSDIWALGVLYHYIYNGYIPFYNRDLDKLDYQDVLNKMVNHEYVLTMDSRINNAMNACLNCNYRERASIDVIMKLIQGI